MFYLGRHLQPGNNRRFKLRMILMPIPLITLTTDFGLEDGYTGMLKGTIYQVNPEALPVDLTHAVQPQNIRQGAFLLYNAYRFFPEGSVHLAVVDPGVGTQRRAICLELAGSGFFVGPDNGLFSYIIDTGLRSNRAMKAYELSNPAFHRSEISRTFHGRDLFAPVAAHLSRGVLPGELGPEIAVKDLVKLEKLWPLEKVDGAKRKVEGLLVHIDHFGNLISNISERVFEGLSEEQLSGVKGACGKLKVKGLKKTYGEGAKKELILLISSGGFVEIARVNGSAVGWKQPELKGVKIGDSFTLRLPG